MHTNNSNKVFIFHHFCVLPRKINESSINLIGLFKFRATMGLFFISRLQLAVQSSRRKQFGHDNKMDPRIIGSLSYNVLLIVNIFFNRPRSV